MKLSEIEEKARAAHVAFPLPLFWPSRWQGEFAVAARDGEGEIIVATPNGNFEWCKPMAAHIAASHPAVVMAMAARIRALAEALEMSTGTFSDPMVERERAYKVRAALDANGPDVELEGVK